MDRNDPKPPAEKLAESAEVMEVISVQQTDSADRRTELAANRTVLAAERTYAAWVRTGLPPLRRVWALRRSWRRSCRDV